MANIGTKSSILKDAYYFLILNDTLMPKLSYNRLSSDGHGMVYIGVYVDR